MSKEGRPVGQQVTFASDALPDDLGEKARRDCFHETFETLMCGVDISFPAEQPFFMNWRFARAGDVRVGLLEGTVGRVVRDKIAIARNPDDDFFVLVNRGPSRIHALQMGQESVSAESDAILLTHGEMSEYPPRRPGRLDRGCFSRRELARCRERRGRYGRPAAHRAKGG
jgi:hypothetical protein